MNCFEHEASPALGLCKACSKGVCRQCARVEESGIFCSEKCAVVGAGLHTMNQRALKIYGIGESRTPLGSGVVVYAFLGAIFFGFGVISYFRLGELDQGDLFAIVMGLAMIGVAFYARWRQKQTGLNC